MATCERQVGGLTFDLGSYTLTRLLGLACYFSPGFSLGGGLSGLAAACQHLGGAAGVVSLLKSCTCLLEMFFPFQQSVTS